MNMKFKPVYNFQSVEFEMEIENEQDLDKSKRLYKAILEMLQEVAVDQPAQVKQVTPKEPMATDKQVATLIKLGVAESEARKMTCKQAVGKIKELIG